MRHSNRRFSSEPRFALNAICPYFTMFPLEYPLGILKAKRSVRGVFDPFCGRGTTLYAARVLGIAASGIDASPVAVAIAQAKLSFAHADDALDLAEDLLAGCAPDEVPEGQFWRSAFHRKTLKQICAIREGLFGDGTEAGKVLRALMLGCLHGPLVRSSGVPSYFSNQMPRTFAPKPDYAVRFWRKARLVPRFSDVLSVLAKKASLVEKDASPPVGNGGQVRLGDSRIKSSYRGVTHPVDIVITSPPYFGMTNYVQDQWLRYWFLGGPSLVQYKNRYQLDHHNGETFRASLSNVWDQTAALGKSGMEAFVRFGSIPSRQLQAQRLLQDSFMCSKAKWKIVNIREAKTAAAGKRQAKQMRVSSAATVEYDLHAVLL